MECEEIIVSVQLYFLNMKEEQNFLTTTYCNFRIPGFIPNNLCFIILVDR